MFRANSTNSDGDESDKRDQSIVMHELGAPWSWMLDFVEHNAPTTKSYSFIEIGDVAQQPVPYTTPIGVTAREDEDVVSDLPRAESLIERDISQVDVVVPIMSGIGKPIQQSVVHDFLNYLRCRSIDENGMIFPRHFKEADCPKMCEN